MYPILVAATVVAGLLNATQAGANGALGRSIGPIAAGLTSLVVSMIGMALVGVATGRLAWPGLERAAQAPWWAWTGGLMGATLIGAQVMISQQLGSAIFVALLVTSSLLMSVVLDHFGLMGFRPHPATLARLGGVALLIAGVLVITRT